MRRRQRGYKREDRIQNTEGRREKINAEGGKRDILVVWRVVIDYLTGKDDWGGGAWRGRPEGINIGMTIAMKLSSRELSFEVFFEQKR